MLSLLAVLSFYYAQLSSKQYSPVFIKDYAVAESLVAGVNPTVVITVIDRESGFDPLRVHKDDGKKGCDSVGLVQIRNCDHPDVSFEEATNPIFAVNFFIQNIDKCHSWWLGTCRGLIVKPQTSQTLTDGRLVD